MKVLLTIFVFLICSSNVFAEPLSGVYKTNPSKTTGGWAHVKFGECKENNSLTCGTLIKAFSKNGNFLKKP